MCGADGLRLTGAFVLSGRGGFSRADVDNARSRSTGQRYIRALQSSSFSSVECGDDTRHGAATVLRHYSEEVWDVASSAPSAAALSLESSWHSSGREPHAAQVSGAKFGSRGHDCPSSFGLECHADARVPWFGECRTTSPANGSSAVSGLFARKIAGDMASSVCRWHQLAFMAAVRAAEHRARRRFLVARVVLGSMLAWS